MHHFVWLVPLLPLLGFLLAGLNNRRWSHKAITLIACGSVLGSFLVSSGIFFELLGSDTKSFTVELFPWIQAGSFHATFSFLIDPLSSLFLLLITGVGFLIHVYSSGYMHHDEGYGKFFAYLNLFVFFMLLLVLGSNYLIMFVGWEGVGLCSYLLIGFWYKKTEYSNAAKKAFIMNRIGDFGFVLGIFLIFLTFGSIEYGTVFDTAKTYASGQPVITAIALLLFVGAMGKSAQLPLFTWLPDAMAGPTPVSALIHAATMVTAGIYMVARSSLIYTLSPASMEVVAIVGIVTALFAATIGLMQNDIKKVLAYSTVSQLGFMFVGLGVGAFTGAVFHVTTHAFFKALLFLSAGSVIHAMGGVQDIRRMGGLKKYLPVTHVVFLVGTLAISGCPPLSGFFSKDEILSRAFAQSPLLWFTGILGALMTTFYMFRLYFLTFKGGFRGTDEQEHHLHESPRSMTWPLIALAVLSVAGGFIGIPGNHALAAFLAPVFELSDMKSFPHEVDHTTEWALMGVAVVVLAAGIFWSHTVYVKQKRLPEEEGAALGPLPKLVYNKFYVDELYNAIFTRPLEKLSDVTYRFFELRFVDAAVNGAGKFVGWGSSIIRYLQAGAIGYYILVMVASIVVMLFYTIL